MNHFWMPKLKIIQTLETFKLLYNMSGVTPLYHSIVCKQMLTTWYCEIVYNLLKIKIGQTSDERKIFPKIKFMLFLRIAIRCLAYIAWNTTLWLLIHHSQAPYWQMTSNFYRIFLCFDTINVVQSCQVSCTLREAHAFCFDLPLSSA